jgi:DNA-binding MarR family transcriptional regulator
MRILLNLQNYHHHPSMSLEKDIQQSKFRNDYHKMTVNIIYTHNWLMEQSRKFFEKADLTPQQFNILRILRGAGKPLSTLQIRQKMLDKMSDTSRIVDRLLKKDLVKKVICKTDRRLVDVTISDKGLALLDSLDHFNQEMDAQLHGLTEDEAKTLNHLMDKLRKSD